MIFGYLINKMKSKQFCDLLSSKIAQEYLKIIHKYKDQIHSIDITTSEEISLLAFNLYSNIWKELVQIKNDVSIKTLITAESSFFLRIIHWRKRALAFLYFSKRFDPALVKTVIFSNYIMYFDGKQNLFFPLKSKYVVIGDRYEFKEFEVEIIGQEISITNQKIN